MCYITFFSCFHLFFFSFCFFSLSTVLYLFNSTFSFFTILWGGEVGWVGQIST